MVIAMSKVYFSPQTDALVTATQQALQSFRYFWREMSWESRRIVPAFDMAAVKAVFSDSDDADAPREQMWITDVELDGKTIYGRLMNEPNELTSVAEGDAVELPVELLADWMFVLDGKAYGAFTVNALRRAMTPDERAEHDDAWGLDFGPPKQTRIVPEAWVSAVEHPMAQNMEKSLEQALATNPSFATTPDARGLTLLHNLALAGTAIGVRVALRHGADKTLRAHNGMTASDMARALGWSEVATLL